MKKMLLLDQHIHGAFGVDFNTCDVDELLEVAEKLYQRNIGGFFPTLVTDTVSNIKRQISIIKQASEKNSRILGVHLEGIFINPENKGIHNPEYFMPLTIDNYKLLEDDFIKIVTLAPELDRGLISYLHSKNVKVQAGHCSGWGDVNGVTHTFNAMSGITHRNTSTALSALVNDNVYAEIIADGIHVNNDALKLFLRSKHIDKVLLISDALPITHSDMKEVCFADSIIYYDGKKATSKNGTIAGSTMLLDEIVDRLKDLDLFKIEYVENSWKYHGIKPF